MRRFFYFSVGLLCLSAALAIGFHLGARSATASYVAEGGQVIAADEGGRCLTADGSGWMLNWNTGNWNPNSDWTLPIPVSQVKFWFGTSFWSKSDEFWVRSAGQWVVLTGAPGGPIGVEPVSWGSIKRDFNKEK